MAVGPSGIVTTYCLGLKLKGPSLLAACDRACESCEGDGPDMCTRCAQGYTLQDNVCVGT